MGQNTTAFQMPDWKFSEGVVWLNWVQNGSLHAVN